MKKVLSLTVAVALVAALLSINVFGMSATSEGLRFKSYGDGTCYLHRSSTYNGTTIVIPPTSPEGDVVVCIDDEAFYNRSDVTSITLPHTVVNIGEGTFAGCSGLQSITIPDAVTSISGYAFLSCTGLTSITIPNGVKEIGYHSFSYCDNITTVKIPASVTELGNYVFSFCPRLESISVDSANTTYHSSSNCIIKTATKTLMLACKNSVIPSDGSVTAIGEGAFAGCSELTSISIPEGVTSIGANAFLDCRNLVSITIPSTVTKIDSAALSDCLSLEKIYYDGSEEEWASIVKELYWDLGTGENTANGSYSVECSGSATDEPTTNASSTEAPETEQPEAEDNAKPNGCTGSVSLGALAFVSVAGACTAIVKKKKDN